MEFEKAGGKEGTPTATFSSEHPRELASFDDKTILVGGELIQDGGDCWLELTQRIKVDELS